LINISGVNSIQGMENNDLASFPDDPPEYDAISKANQKEERAGDCSTYEIYSQSKQKGQ